MFTHIKSLGVYAMITSLFSGKSSPPSLLGGTPLQIFSRLPMQTALKLKATFTIYFYPSAISSFGFFPTHKTLDWGIQKKANKLNGHRVY